MRGLTVHAKASIYLAVSILISAVFFVPLSAAQEAQQKDEYRIDRGRKMLSDEPRSEERAKERAAQKRRFAGRIAVSGGYDSNVISKGKGANYPEGVTDKDSFGNGVFAAGEYQLYRGKNISAWAGGIYNSSYYYGELKEDYDVQYLEPYIRFACRLTEKWIAGMRANYSHAWVGYANFGNWAGLAPSLYFLQSDWAYLRLTYGFESARYFYGLTERALNKDGYTNYIEASQNAKIPRTELSTAFGYRHSWQNTRGSDYDLNSGALFFNAWHPLPFNVDWNGGIGYTFSDQRKINSRSRENSIGYVNWIARKDDDLRFTTGLSKKILKGMSLFVMYDFSYELSNLSVFQFRRHAVTGGASYDF